MNLSKSYLPVVLMWHLNLEKQCGHSNTHINPEGVSHQKTGLQRSCKNPPASDLWHSGHSMSITLGISSYCDIFNDWNSFSDNIFITIMFIRTTGGIRTHTIGVFLGLSPSYFVLEEFKHLCLYAVAIYQKLGGDLSYSYGSFTPTLHGNLPIRAKL